MWANDYGEAARSRRYNHVGCKRFVQAHYLKEPVVPVRVTEDPEGSHYGWIDTDATKPSMIFPHLIQFRCCFPYGLEAHEKAGKGRAVRLRIEHHEHNEP